MDRLLRKCVLGSTLLLCSGMGQATDQVVSTCDETHFSTAFSTVDGSGGGTITFACSGTITFTSYKQVSGNDVIDGGGNVTFNGAGSSPFFQVFSGHALALKRLTLQNGANGASHPLEVYGTLALNNVTLTAHATTGSVLYNGGGNVTIAASTFSLNHVTGGSELAGAAARNIGGIVAISTSTFSNNGVDSTTQGQGGAISNESGGALYVRDSTFVSNNAFNGAAIYSDSELHIINSTFRSNSAMSVGGAVYQSSSSNSTLDFITLSGNSAAAGAGIYNDGSNTGTMYVGKSIFAGNSTGNCDGANFVSTGYNLANDTGCGGFFGGTDTSNASLPLGGLANNGGPTQTMSLSAGNAALNKVPAASCTTSTGTTVRYDQRLATRSTGSACDSGAYQHNGTFDRIFDDEFDF